MIAGIQSRAEEEPTEEQRLEALYQKLLQDEPALGRTPKAELLPRLKAMLERGEGKNLRFELSNRQRVMNFGRYLSDLIWGARQVPADDADLKRVHDLGVAEIRRQGQSVESSPTFSPGRIFSGLIESRTTTIQSDSVRG